MAVDYTKVFTIAGKLIVKGNTYYAWVAQATTDQAAVQTIYTAQSAANLIDGLDAVYDEIRQEAVGWMELIVGRVTGVLTDDALVLSQFYFGYVPDVQAVLKTLIHDMATTDKNVKPSAATVGSVSYSTVNSPIGVMVLTTTLDGINPPVSGGLASLDYAGVTTQMTPDSETLLITCTQDSEHGATEGGESWAITGTGSASGPFSVDGENVGNGGSVATATIQAGNWLTNSSFDSWASNAPSGWTVVDGTAGTTFEEDATNTVRGDGSAIVFNGASGGDAAILTQVLNKDQFVRRQAYFVFWWARKLTDALADGTVTIKVSDDTGTLVTFGAQPTSTTWAGQTTTLLVPVEIEGDLVLTVSATIDSDTVDPVIIDEIVIVPVQYVAGVGLAIFAGPEKFLQGDTMSVALSNNNAGKFQSWFRKAYRVQLPTDATPTISDTLVA